MSKSPPLLCLVFILMSLAWGGSSATSAETKPFPQAALLKYKGIKPNNHSQAELNATVLKAYTAWKKRYLIPSSLVSGDYKIAFNSKKWTVSEAMGYGMLITVQMAGADPNARKYFDGLNRFRKRYPSDINPAFMNWEIKNEAKVEENDSATDGDMDMAMALLMAEAQWGGGKYVKEAKVLIRELGKTLVRPDYSLRLGDWDTDDQEIATRPSDFTTAHFRAFGRATGDPLWSKVEEKCYAILGQLQKDYASGTGLVPDFALRNKDGKWKPAQPNFLEDETDGDYSYNACRVPWRIGFSAVRDQDTRARDIILRFTKWADKTQVQPARFLSGYSLKGQGLVDYSDPTFISPTGVAAMVGGNQKWVNGAFDLSSQSVDYYADSLALLSMLVMSGNAWLP